MSLAKKGIWERSVNWKICKVQPYPKRVFTRETSSAIITYLAAWVLNFLVFSLCTDNMPLNRYSTILVFQLLGSYVSICKHSLVDTSGTKRVCTMNVFNCLGLSEVANLANSSTLSLMSWQMCTTWTLSSLSFWNA